MDISPEAEEDVLMDFIDHQSVLLTPTITGLELAPRFCSTSVGKLKRVLMSMNLL